MEERLEQAISFIKEVEKLKTVTRQNQTLDGRYENSAEHSWQLAMMAVTLQDFYPDHLDMQKVLTMLLLHDLGEIGVGDTSVFDDFGKATSYDREHFSLQKTLSFLSDAQADNYYALWQDFEKGQSKEARYARCMDALAPLLNHSYIAKENYNPDDLTKSQVLQKKAFIKDESEALWELIVNLIDESVTRGLYRDDT